MCQFCSNRYKYIRPAVIAFMLPREATISVKFGMLAALPASTGIRAAVVISIIGVATTRRITSVLDRCFVLSVDQCF